MVTLCAVLRPLMMINYEILVFTHLLSAKFYKAGTMLVSGFGYVFVAFSETFDTLPDWGKGGVIGVLLGVIYYLYVKREKDLKEARKNSEEKTNKIIDELRKTIEYERNRKNDKS